MIIDLKKVEQLKSRYSSVPPVMRRMSHWIGWNYKITSDGRKTKVPMNAMNGDFAESDNQDTWCDFDTAVRGVVAFGFEGIGFMLGDGIAGIDLDNHPNQDGEYPLTEEQFNDFSEKIIRRMNAYSEYSPSGKGVHIIFQANLPDGRRKSPAKKLVDGIHHDVEMYDHGRFFTVTGNVINASDIEPRDREAYDVWKEYVDDSDEIAAERAKYGTVSVIPGSSQLTDREIIDRCCSNAKYGAEFTALYGGNTSSYNDDHSAADLGLVNYLTFWTGCDAVQIDRIFRTSGLMRDKWDRKMGDSTYGAKTIETAISHCRGVYQKPAQIPNYVYQVGIDVANHDLIEAKNEETFMNLAKNGSIIFHRNAIGTGFTRYELDDLGNARRFLDTYGDLFRYNADDKTFMFWTGKVWKESPVGYVEQYVDDFVDVLNKQYMMMNRISSENGPDADKIDDDYLKSFYKNIVRLRNTQGMNTMMARLKTQPGMQATWDDFDNNKYYLNTESGIVDIRDGKIIPFDRKLMQSRSTKCKVSFNEPKRWIRFLHEIFWRGDDEQSIREENELVELMQQLCGMFVLGERREQYIFILVGGGSNGKSTMLDELAYALGDYYGVIDSSVLMSKMNPVAAQNALAQTVGQRVLAMSEASSSGKMNINLVKQMTGEKTMQAQKKFGQPFEIHPVFTPIMMTNNLPIVAELDYGTWRRICPIPFMRRFTEDEKDLDLPEKLFEETPDILGWCIKGYQKYAANGSHINLPKVVLDERERYNVSMNNVSSFIRCKCIVGSGCQTKYDVLYKAYLDWTKSMNQYQFPQRDFDRELKENQGFSIDDSDGKAWIWRGVMLNFGENTYEDIF